MEHHRLVEIVTKLIEMGLVAKPKMMGNLNLRQVVELHLRLHNKIRMPSGKTVSFTPTESGGLRIQEYLGTHEGDQITLSPEEIKVILGECP